MRNESRANDRDRGLLRIVRVNRLTIGAAVVLTGVLSSVAALAHPGSSRHASSGAAAPSAAPSDPNTVPSDPNAGPDGQSAAPSDPSQAPVAPQSAPQGVPDGGGPPAATSGGS